MKLVFLRNWHLKKVFFVMKLVFDEKKFLMKTVLVNLHITFRVTIFDKIITVLTRYRPIVFELICSRNACNFTRRLFFRFNIKQ